MANAIREQWTIKKTSEIDNLPGWFDAFLLDRRSQSMSKGTIAFYTAKLKLFDRFIASQGITSINDLTPAIIRAYLVHLSQTHNPGGVHCALRTLRAFLNWYEREEQPVNWHNPTKNIKPPKLSDKPLDPVETATIQKLIATCDTSLIGLRDKAILLFLLDTGVRAGEMVALNRDDLNPVTGSVIIRHGKGDKLRIVVIGKKTRKAVREYLQARADNSDTLWLSENGTRLTYWGLNLMLKRRSAKAHVDKPELHAFRRAFALNCLRNGMDIYSLQLLMGHADLQVMRRYLAQTDDDLQVAHAHASPVDNAM